MGAVVSIALGLVLGVICALPLALLQCSAARGEAHLAAGVASVLGSFLVLQAALVAAWKLAPDAVVPFGLTAVFAFLATVIVAVAVWHVR